MMRDDLRRVEEQSPLRVAQKAMRAAERVLLRHSGKREWLAWEAGKQYVMFWYQTRNVSERANVALDGVIVPEVRLIGYLAVLVPLACKDTVPTNLLKSTTQSTYSCEQVYEMKNALSRRHDYNPRRMRKTA